MKVNLYLKVYIRIYNKLKALFNVLKVLLTWYWCDGTSSRNLKYVVGL